tara:strand:- start:925 stop:1215 length:291 start_codon:yes stop_codon:yes gene_type:complete
MKIIGQIHEGHSGIYTLSKKLFSVRKWEVRYAEIYTRTTQYEYLGSFQFKSEALDFIKKTENEFLNSEPHLQSLVDSGLLTKNEMLERLEGENNEI